MFKKNSIENLLGKEKKQVPLLPLRDIVVFPGMVLPLFIGREKSIDALKYALSQEKEIFLSTQKKAKMDNPTRSR
jgi:ATP-dependent Lon protease